jgi:hypothetical protein
LIEEVVSQEVAKRALEEAAISNILRLVALTHWWALMKLLY